MKTLVWLRTDLRVSDNSALLSATEAGQVAVCYIPALEQHQEHDTGLPRLKYLEATVRALSLELAKLGIPFELLDAARFDDAPAALVNHAKNIGANTIAFNNEYPWNERKRDNAVVSMALASGLKVARYDDDVILSPGTVTTQQGAPFRVFTPFKRRWLSLINPTLLEPLPQPEPIGTALAPTPVDFGLAADPDFSQEAGEHAGQQRLHAFLDANIDTYATGRDHPALEHTSRLSPYLSVGALSIRQSCHAAYNANDGRLAAGPLASWINELIWREFYRHVTALFPRVSRNRNFNPKADALPWRDAPQDLEAWQKGETGYPFVDAGMRQLNETGWMHNRLRMVTAAFLSKHLLIDWRHGEEYFMRHLIDGDFASNNGGWQWSASTGTDAMPYFRIFNPNRQGEKFDRDGLFTLRYLPELAALPTAHLYKPERYPLDVRYPTPIVDHDFARQRALATFKAALG